MLDHSEKVLVDSETMKRRVEEDMIEQNKTSVNDKKKTCADCGTSKTPLWRGGPAGPKSLCNACGIRNRKKRRGTEDSKKLKKSSSGGGNPKLGDSLEQRLMDFGMTKRSTVEKQRRKLDEEEQAAVLLMALSYVFTLSGFFSLDLTMIRVFLNLESNDDDDD